MEAEVGLPYGGRETGRVQRFSEVGVGLDERIADWAGGSFAASSAGLGAGVGVTVGTDASVGAATTAASPVGLGTGVDVSVGVDIGVGEATGVGVGVAALLQAPARSARATPRTAVRVEFRNMPEGAIACRGT